MSCELVFIYLFIYLFVFGLINCFAQALLSANLPIFKHYLVLLSLISFLVILSKIMFPFLCIYIINLV